jgi:hypothetical protein
MSADDKNLPMASQNLDPSHEVYSHLTHNM